MDTLASCSSPKSEDFSDAEVPEAPRIRSWIEQRFSRRETPGSSGILLIALLMRRDLWPVLRRCKSHHQAGRLRRVTTIARNASPPGELPPDGPSRDRWLPAAVRRLRFRRSRVKQRPLANDGCRYRHSRLSGRGRSSGRNANHGAPWLDIVCNDGSGTNDGSFSDRHTLSNHCSCSNVGELADAHRTA